VEWKCFSAASLSGSVCSRILFQIKSLSLLFKLFKISENFFTLSHSNQHQQVTCLYLFNGLFYPIQACFCGTDSGFRDMMKKFPETGTFKALKIGVGVNLKHLTQRGYSAVMEKGKNR
jgi:hypothetical protein